MSVPPETLAWVRQWIDKAEADLRTAEHTLTIEEECPFDTVCFHAQQCAEKYLKALLVWRQRDFPKTHDLRVLLQLVSAELPVAIDSAEMLPLNRYSVETRYPGDWEPIERSEAEEALLLARKVRAAARARLPEGALA